MSSTLQNVSVIHEPIKEPVFTNDTTTSKYNYPIEKKSDSKTQFVFTNAIKVYGFRHGESAHNPHHLMVSSYKSDLTEKGKITVRKNAKKLALHLQKEKTSITKIYCSPLPRTINTANIVADEIGFPREKITLVNELKEQYYGSYEGKTYDAYVAQFDGKEKDAEFVLGAEDGETGMEVYERIESCLKNIFSNTENENSHILFVTHAYPFCQMSKILTGEYNNIPKTGEWRLIK